MFNDQLAGSMTDAQYRFSAQNYVGTQKVLQKDARRLRAVNPDFLILHYRLGQALGHSMPAAGCAPSTNMIQIVDGNRWVQEWPGDDKVEEEWFYHVQGQRVFSCTNGHFLFDLTNARLKEWWTGEVMRQLEANEDDAVFADSYSVPNYFGACDWKPCLPVVDAAFERDWAQREHDFTDYVRERFAGRWKWIPNIGTLVTTRDPSDYGNIDGAMVEGFAEWGGHRWLDPSDWQLQMNRVLALVAQDKIIIAQSYPQPDDVEERMFILGSYLLIKGRHTYVNLDMGLEPEWFPEYGIDLGAASQPPPARIGALLDARWPLFARRYAKGLVLVNPGTAVQDAALDTPMWRVIPSGGGRVSPDGNATGTLRYERTGQVAVPPHGAAILLTSNPSR